MKTKIWYILIILSLVAIVRWIILLFKKNKLSVIGNTSKNIRFSPIIYPTQIREDFRGSGEYQAVRLGHRHEGIDLLCAEGQNVHAPFAGTITRIAYPYTGNTKWTGLVLEAYNGFTMRLFYISPTKLGQKVEAGDVIGVAQAISKKYGAGMKDHIHVELLKDNIHIDPSSYFI